MTGGAGPDALLGGEVNDRIDARDEENDPLVDCGSGGRDRSTPDPAPRKGPRGTVRIARIG